VPGTPVENVQAVVKMVKAFSPKYSRVAVPLVGTDKDEVSNG
jgi:hypothetical protein